MKKRKFSFIGAVVLALAITGCSGVANRLEQNRLQVGGTAKTSFNATAGDYDDNIAYECYRGGGTSNPAVNSNQIRLYQGTSTNAGGMMVVKVKEGANYVITSVTVGTGMNTTLGYKIGTAYDASTAVSNFTNWGSLSNGSTKTLSNINSTVVTFACLGTSSSSRWYVNSLTVTYSEPGQIEGPENLNDPSPVYNDANKRVTWTTDTRATKYQYKVDDAVDFTDLGEATYYDASNLTANVSHTVYIKAVGDETNYASATGSVTFTPTPVFVSKQYVLCTAESDLEAGVTYLITSGKTGTVKTMSKAQKANNRDGVDVTVTNSKISSSNDYLILSLSGSLGEWNFSTENYDGTNGYLASASSSDNYLRVINTADDCTITFNANESANITFSSNSSRNLLRYNSTNNANVFACYASGQQPVYLWKEYRLLTDLNVTGTPTKTSYSDSEAFDPTGITAYEAVYDDNHVRNILPIYIRWPELTSSTTSIRGSFTENGVTVYTPTYTISVSSDSLSSVSLSGSIISNYFTDSEWNLGTLAVTANYTSGQQVDVTADATIAIYSNSVMTSELEKPGDLGVVTNQTVYIKATYENVSNTTGYEQSVTVTVEHGTVENDPLTADEAITKGVALGSYGNQTTKEYYVFGVVASIDENKLAEDDNYATFVLVNNNQTVDFQGYRIQPAQDCGNYDKFKVGAEVLLKCKIKRFSSSIVENGSTGSILSISYTAPELTGIELNKDETVIKVGAEETLVASATPLGAELGTVTWTSSKPEVATVNQQGVITGVSEGNTIISATAGGFTDTCTVVVSLNGTLDLTTNTTTSATNTALTWNVANKFDMRIDKANATTKTNNYYPNENNSYVVTRAYQNSRLTLSPVASKVTAVQAVFEMSSNSYANSLAGSTFTNGEAVASNNKVIVTFTNGTQPISVIIPDKIDFVSVDFLYQTASVSQEVRYSTQTRASLSYEYIGNETDGYVFDNVTIRFRGFISVELWDELDADSGILGYGVMLSKDSYLGTDTIEGFYNVALELTGDVDEAIDGTCDQQDIWNYYMPLSSTKTHPAVAEDSQKGDLDGDYYIWNLRKLVAESNFTTSYASVAYIRTNNGIVFMNEIRTSVQELADKMIKSDAYDETSLDGSLNYLATL